MYHIIAADFVKLTTEVPAFTADLAAWQAPVQTYYAKLHASQQLPDMDIIKSFQFQRQALVKARYDRIHQTLPACELEWSVHVYQWRLSAGGEAMTRMSLLASAVLLLPTAPALAQATGTVTPFNGSGAPLTPQSISITASDAGGWPNIAHVDVLINSAASGANACFVVYFPQHDLGARLRSRLVVTGTSR